MIAGPSQLDIDRFRRLVALGLICRRSDGALAAHSDLQKVPKRLVESWDRPWTPADDAELQRHCQDGASISAMADCMRRKRCQIVARLAAHGPPPAYPWTDAARRLVISNSRSWRHAARALGVPRADAQRVGRRLRAKPDPTVPMVRVSLADKRHPERPNGHRVPIDAHERIEIGDQPADATPSVHDAKAFGRLLRLGHVAVREDGTLVVDQRLLVKPRERAAYRVEVRDADGQRYADRISARDARIVAATKAYIPVAEIARQEGMTRWGVTLVIRRHGIDFTPLRDRLESKALRAAVRAAMRSSPSLPALAHQVGLSLGKASYMVRQIDPTWVARRAKANLTARRRLRRERIERLRMALICRQMSMNQAGRAAQVQRTQPGQILVHGPNAETVGLLARVLHVPEAWLSDGTGPAPAGISAGIARRLVQRGSSQQGAARLARRQRCEAALRRLQPKGWKAARIARHLGYAAHYVRTCARRLSGSMDRPIRKPR